MDLDHALEQNKQASLSLSREVHICQYALVPQGILEHKVRKNMQLNQTSENKAIQQSTK